MSEAQKERTIEIITNTLDRLGGLLPVSPYPNLLNTNALLSELRITFRFLDKQEYLLKGYFKSHNLARALRRFQIELKAEDIAIETGADKWEVQAELEEMLSEYLNPIG